MTRFGTLLGAVIAAVSVGACTVRVNRAPAAASADDTRAEILALESRWNDAIVRKDTAAVARILADDFVYVAPNGYVAKRAELLSVIANPAARQDPIVTHDVVVRRYGDAVVVTGWFRQSGTSAGTRFDSVVRYTDVYVRQNGGWKAVSAQASTMPKAPS